MQLRKVIQPWLIRILLDLCVVLLGAGWIASLLGTGFLLSTNLPTGGDSASHLLYVWTYAHELLLNGHITAWMPEVFAGFPFLSYYFPLSFISIAGLSYVLPFAPAMKLGMFAAAMLLPGAVWLGSVYLLRLSRTIAILAVLGSMAFLLHEQNSIWGGNLLSTLAGEFAYSYGMLFSMLALFAWQRTIATGRHWWLAALLEAATGFSHGFPLLITGFATTVFLFHRKDFLRNLRLLLLGHGLAFFLLAGWLWPMLEMHSITIPNDAPFEITGWRDLLPKPVQPVLIGGLVAIMLLGIIRMVPRLQRLMPSTPAIEQAIRHAGFMVNSALLSGIFYLAGSAIGFANIRFFPFVWLFGGIACGWLIGAALLQLATALPTLSRVGLAILASAGGVGFAVWISLQAVIVPDWGLWNHSGLEAKPQWNLLTRLFPTLSGSLGSSRLLFEHDPANNDIGSTRALEALPMFLGGRPVLEGLYMESSIVSPAVYQLQSEVSTKPSSPLARFPSGYLDLESAAPHMNFMYAQDVLIRNEKTRDAFAASQVFTEIASSPPFYVFRLKQFDSHIVDLVKKPLHWFPKKGWMEESFRWFRSKSRFTSELPVFDDGLEKKLVTPTTAARIRNFEFERHQLSWHTDAVGSAHLVRMSWHPRWKLATKGSIHLAGPGFMLVIPEESNVVLEYGQTSIGFAGMIATILSLLALSICIWSEIRPRRAVQVGSLPVTRSQIKNKLWYPARSRVAFLWPIALISAGAWLYANNPERQYTDAWELYRASKHSEAAIKFDRAFAGRKSEPKKEEALFWSAKAYEQAGKANLASQRYRELTTSFHGYWLPEALYNQWRLAAEGGQTDESAIARNRLLSEFSNDRWTKRMNKEANE